MRPKFVFASMSPVISSTFSICLLMRSFTRSMRPSAGHLIPLSVFVAAIKCIAHTLEVLELIFLPPRHASRPASHGSLVERCQSPDRPLEGCHQYPFSNEKNEGYRGIIAIKLRHVRLGMEVAVQTRKADSIEKLHETVRLAHSKSPQKAPKNS